MRPLRRNPDGTGLAGRSAVSRRSPMGPTIGFASLRASHPGEPPSRPRATYAEIPCMILVLDCGHSRLAWGLVGERGWEASGSLPNQDIGTLALRDWQNLPRPMRAVGVNVAGEAARVRVEAQ